MYASTKLGQPRLSGYQLSQRLPHVLTSAVEEARARQHTYVGTEHLLLGLLRERDGVPSAIFAAAHVDIDAMRNELDARVSPGTAPSASGLVRPYTSQAKKVLEYAMAESRNFNHSYVGTEHLLLGLLREAVGVGAQLLTHGGVSLPFARAETRRLTGPQTLSLVGPAESRPITGRTMEVRFADGGVVQRAIDALNAAIHFFRKQT